jgi:hypothetical protein
MSRASNLSKAGALVGSDGKVPAAGIADGAITQAKFAANVAGNGPAFSAAKAAGGTQTLSAGVWTKLLFPDEGYDTNNNFTGSTFTPTVAGLYWVRVAAAQVTTGTQLGIYKNGVLQSAQNAGSGSGDWLEHTALIQCNGSTDTIEGWAYAPAGMNFIANSILCQFQAFLARAA